MISEIVGQLIQIHEGLAQLRLGPVTAEVLVPAIVEKELAEAGGQEIAFHTLFMIEGNTATAGNLTPRLVGFTSLEQRGFFHLLTKVKGVSTRKALRAMAIPHSQLAAAIAEGDQKLLTSLPEIGKRTAAQMVTELREQAADYAQPVTTPSSASSIDSTPLSDAHRTALEILVQWGDRRGDVEQWLAQVAASRPELVDPEEIVRAAYEVKRGNRV